MLEVKDKHLRFKDAKWFLDDNNKQTILIGGMGGTGSWTSLLLSRANFNIIAYDMDTIEEVNLAGQFYGAYQIDSPKVVAVANNIRIFCDEVISTYAEEYTIDSPAHYFMVAAFDNMKARKIMFENWLKEVNDWKKDKSIFPYEPLFVDMRLSAEHMQILCITSDDERIREYQEKYLFNDSEVEEAPCTFKQTSHAATMIASHTVGFITNHIANQIDPAISRIVPFYWEYYIPIDFNKKIIEVVKK